MRQVFVRTLTGKTIVLEAEIWDSVDQLKQRIQDKEGIPKDQQKLVLAGKELQGGQCLSDCNFPGESQFHLLIRKPMECPPPLQ